MANKVNPTYACHLNFKKNSLGYFKENKRPLEL